MGMKEYIKALQNYFNFKDRSSRRDYWMFVLVHVLISFGLGMIIGFFKAPSVISNVYALALLFPAIAVAIRRMHDINKSGWFILIPFYSLYLLCVAGDKAANRFGPPPATASPAAPLPYKVP